MKKIITEHKAGLLKILISLLLVLEAEILEKNGMLTMSYVCHITSYGIIAYRAILGALSDLISRRKIGEELLMSVASLGALAIGERFEAIIVLVLYTAGEIFEHIATDYSTYSIESLSKIRPDKARLFDAEMVNASSVAVGELIEVYPGERITLDSELVEGQGTVDTSAITGESTPVSIRAGSELLAGYLNLSSPLKLKVIRKASSSAAQRIIDLSKNALERKTKSEKFISVFARIYTPIVILLALIVAIVPPLFDEYSFIEWGYKAFSMLAISCPCAIVISVPLAYFCAIGYASGKGILIKGSCVIDSLCKVKTIAFDKTGTLTKAELHVTKIEPISGIDKSALLRYVGIAELKSNHPIATAVLYEAKKFNISIDEGENYQEKSGFGVECDSKYGHIKAGNREFVNCSDEVHGSVHITLNDKYIGSVTLGDEIKPNSKKAFAMLKGLGIKNKVIISGDKKTKVKIIARSLLADKAYYELTPEGKLETVEALMSESKGNVAYCGDGINDTPSLARADIGIAMGALGSDSAVECSDIVIMDDDIIKVPKAIKIAKSTRRTVISCIAISIAIKIAMLVLNALGITTMLWAVVGDVGVLILAIILALFAGR